MKKKLLAATSAVMAVASLTPVSTLAEETKSFDWFVTASALPETWDMEQPIFKGITDATGCIPQVTIPAADADTKLNLMIANNNLPDLITLTMMT